jgi:hypothetical protein
MGWYTNYEVEFAYDIDWDDYTVAKALPHAAKHLYLRDLDKPRVMLCIYSQSSVEEVLATLKQLYRVSMRYRVYSTEEWLTA